MSSQDIHRGWHPYFRKMMGTVYDIADDPRFDKTPGPMSIVVARSPVVILASRKKILKLLNLPSTATWEDANPILKNKIVRALKANNEDEATKWNAIRDQLEKALAHYCDCGELIAPKVRQCSQCRNIRVAHANRKHGWWKKNKAFLGEIGKMSDVQIAKRWKLGRTSIWRIRRSLGIRAYDCFHGEDDGDRTARRRKLHESVISALGTVSDAEIERRYGLLRQYAFQERQRRGIPAFKPQVRHSLSRVHRGLMGTMNDVELGKRAGVPSYAIRYFRKKAGIRAFEATNRTSF